MLIPEEGVHQTSERYFFTPSSLARELFYYPMRCGHYFCNHQYSFSHQSKIAQEGDHNRNIMLFAVQDGAMELGLSGQTVLAASGQCVLFDCQEPYCYTASDGAEFTWFLFGGLNARAFYRRILQARSGKQVLRRLLTRKSAPARFPAQRLRGRRAAERSRMFSAHPPAALPAAARRRNPCRRTARPYDAGNSLYEPPSL